MKASILEINHQKLSCIGAVMEILSRKNCEGHQMESASVTSLKFGIKTKSFTFRLHPKPSI
jgi:hypothetical protein